MKMRLVYLNKKTLLYCEDGSTLEVDDTILRKLFVLYQTPSAFGKGEGRWTNDCDAIEDAPGRTLAYVNDKNELCIVDGNPFYQFISSVGNQEYIPLKEYADLHQKNVARIKVLCSEQRLAGAVRKGGCWFIPINTPYPQDGRANGKKGS